MLPDKIFPEDFPLLNLTSGGMGILIYILLSVIGVSAISLVGVLFLIIRRNMLKFLLPMLIAFASGALLGSALLHLVPEGYEALQSRKAFLLVLSGIVLSFVLEKFFYWHHCHDENCELRLKPYVWLNLLGDGMHNFIDGAIIASSYMLDFNLGVVTTLAVIFHEIPQEIGDFGILVSGGLSPIKALGINFGIATTAIGGAILGYLIGESIADFSAYLALFASGGFIYLATADLFPELHREVETKKSLLQIVSLTLGIWLMATI